MKELVRAFQVPWPSRSVLVLGPDASRVGEWLMGEYGVSELEAAASPSELGGQLEQRLYDVAVVGDFLYELSPTRVHDAFRWIHDHLRPAGEVLVQTRTYLGPDGGGLGDHVRTPYAHLAFASDALLEYYEWKGWPPPAAVNCMCRASYFVMFRRAGLEIEEVSVEESEPQAFADKLRWYDAQELRAGSFRARLRRSDEQRELTELTAVRAS